VENNKGDFQKDGSLRNKIAVSRYFIEILLSIPFRLSVLLFLGKMI